MTNGEFMKKIRKTKCYRAYVLYLGEHGHGHYHTAAMTR